MANYTTQTSNKSKGKAIKLLLCGGLGLHLFYVGKIGAGILRFLLGLGTWAIMILSVVSPETLGTQDVPMVLVGLLMLVILNIWDLIKLALGKFRDNVGDFLRA